MAGSYNDAPDRRMAWDDDGTVAVRGLSSGTSPLSTLSSGQRDEVNSEESSRDNGVDAEDSMIILLFPELRDIDGVFASIANQVSTCNPEAFQVSADSTNGVDGTWDTSIGDLPNFYSTYNLFRDNIQNVSETNKAGVRAHGSSASSGYNDWEGFHIYGTFSAGETPDRILFLDTENADAVFTKVLDFGDVPRGQTTTRTFKIKNNSASLSINSVVVAAEDLYLNAGGWYTFGDDGITYVASFNVGNMANGAEETIHMKQVISGGETLGLQTARIKVSHASVT